MSDNDGDLRVDSTRCQQVVELVTDYLEGALEEVTRTELEAHLRLCGGCDLYLAQMRRTIELLGHVPLDTLSQQVQRELVAAFGTIRAAPREGDVGPEGEGGLARPIPEV